MQQIPGFAPRRCGVIRGKPEQMQAVPYGELVLLFLEEIPPSRLAVRLISLKNRGEVKEFMFRSGQHKKRFREICGSGEYDFLHSDHGRAAAVFLLSADSFLWDRAKKCITRERIRYQEIVVHGIEPDGYALFCAAKEMCGGTPRLSLSELGDPEVIQCQLVKSFKNRINGLNTGIKCYSGMNPGANDVDHTICRAVFPVLWHDK